MRRLRRADLGQDRRQQEAHIVGRGDGEMHRFHRWIERVGRVEQQADLGQRAMQGVDQRFGAMRELGVATDRDQQLVLEGGAQLTQDAANPGLRHAEGARRPRDATRAQKLVQDRQGIEIDPAQPRHQLAGVRKLEGVSYPS
jgi:hypothetical protein